MTVQAPTTLKNGTLTSSYTNDPRFHLLVACADTVAENMTISQPENKGASWIVEVTSPKFTMIDSTITIATYSGGDTRGINVTNQGVLLFYGNNKINATDVSFIGDSYFYSGTLETNQRLNAYEAKKVCFCGGAVKNTAGGVFSSLSADKVILQNDGDDYAIYSDENCTVPMTAAGAASASAIYSKLVAAYTVTWQNDDGTPLSASTVTEGTTPSYDSTPPTKTTADGKKYAFAGWTDGTNIYGLNDTLPAVTGDVTYTAVFEEYDKDFARDVGYFVGDKINFGDTYIKDYIWQNAKTYHISGVYTLVSAVYDSNKRYYIATLQSRNETIQLITNGYSDMGEQIAFVASSGVGTSSQPYQFQMKKYGTVIWKDEDGNVVETDEKVLNDARPSYDGEALTKESEEPDKYHYVLRWSKDNTNAPYEYDQLFDVSFRDTDTVTYNAVFLKAQYVAENGVYFIGDTIDFNGKYVKMEDSGGVGVVNSIKTIQNIRLYNASTGRYQVALHQSRSTGYFYFTVGENYGSKVAYVVKSGTGTQDDPYIMGIAPYFTVTWKNGEDIIETDEKVIEGDTPTYDGEIPTKIDETDTYKYVFSGWSPAVTEVTGDAVYTAQFDRCTIIHDSDVLVNSTVTTPEILVTDHITGDILTEDTDYTLTVNDDNTVTVTGIGNYAGEVTKPFITLSKDVSVDVTRKKTSTGARVTLSGEWLIPEGAEILESGVARVHVSNTEGITKEYIYEHGIKKSPCVQYRNVKMAFSINLNKTAAQKKICAVTYVKYKIGDKKFTSISDVKFA